MFSHPNKRRLMPAEVFSAAVGLLLSLGYEEGQRFNDGMGEPLAQVFEREGERVVLYYPGKDNNDAMTDRKTTRSLLSIYQAVKEKIEPALLNNAREIFFICESSIIRKHYVLAIKTNNQVDLYDSLSKRKYYSLENIREIFADKKLKPHYADAQKDKNSCGIYALTTLEHYLKNKKISLKNLNLDTAYETMAAHYERVEKCKPAFLYPPLKKNKFVLQGYPKYLLIGAAIGIGLAALCVGLAFAWPLVLPAIGWLGVGLISGGAFIGSTGIALFSNTIRNAVKKNHKTKQRPKRDSLAEWDPSYAKIIHSITVIKKSGNESKLSIKNSGGFETQEEAIAHFEKIKAKYNAKDRTAESSLGNATPFQSFADGTCEHGKSVEITRTELQGSDEGCERSINPRPGN